MKQELVCRRASAPLTVDGDLGKTVWNEAERTPRSRQCLRAGGRRVRRVEPGGVRAERAQLPHEEAEPAAQVERRRLMRRVLRMHGAGRGRVP